MTSKVVYVLGAGFSAPLGLPLMSTFLPKSKDLYFAEPDRLEHFQRVFDAIDRMSVAKNYFDADLFNIEEILSILEMQSFTEGEQFAESFNRYLCDTILGLTPELKPREPLPGNWQDFVYGDNSNWRRYGHFIGAICGFTFTRRHVRGVGDPIEVAQAPASEVQYSVVTLNYDRVLEAVPEFLRKHYQAPEDLGFRRPQDDAVDRRPLLAKLHGSVELGSLVPPTWSKGSHPQIVADWSAALAALREANHVRIIGYSLPVSDAYVRYLLKSAAIGVRHLKTLDVINLDNDGDAQSRYDRFITFNYYRFANASTELYLDAMRERLDKTTGAAGLEQGHEAFMTKHVAKCRVQRAVV